jgi:mono/diheme cytochrome c family protein
MKTPAFILLTAATLAAATLYAQGSTTNDGIGTDAQVKRGSDVYQMMCAACHDAQLAGSGTAPALAGTDFSANWKDENVNSLFERIRATMPADNPGSLKRDQVADLVAFILNFNKYPLGQKDLPTDSEALKAIKITAPK